MNKRLMVLSLAFVLGCTSVAFAERTPKKTKPKNVTLVSAPLYKKDEQKKYEIIYDFKDGLQGFCGSFADLPTDEDVEEFYELKFGHAKVPIPGENIMGLLLSGNNHSDDLFMYTYANIGKALDLEDNTDYKFNVKFSIATDAPAGASGIGGAPGESVYVKAGVVNKEPKNIIDDNGYYRLNLDKGNQQQSGEDVFVVGNLAKTNGTTDRSYENKQYKFSVETKTDERGNAYLIIGTDSGFEGRTTIYVNDIVIDAIKVK